MNLRPASLAAVVAGVLAFGLPTVALAAMPGQTVYVAHLHAMNTGVTGTAATGQARFVVGNGKLTIDIKMHGVSPDTVHWQHFHGFKDGQPAACPTAAADVNHDGIVDLIETGKASGTTMLPFIARPVTMDVAHGTYPRANARGEYEYKQIVPLKALQAAFAKVFPGQKLDLAKRVVYVHGIPSATRLPDSVASLGPIPAQVTLPVACGRIEAVPAHAGQ